MQPTTAPRVENAPVQEPPTVQELILAPAIWRLIIDDQPRSGAANMAMDQALAEAAAAGDAPPTLALLSLEPTRGQFGSTPTDHGY